MTMTVTRQHDDGRDAEDVTSAADQVTVDETRPTRRRKGEVRRQQILDVATHLFAVGGFNKVSLADVAAKVGMTQAGILHHFPSKVALLLSVLQEREARNEEVNRRRVESGLTYLEAYTKGLETNEQYPELVQLFVITSAEATAPGHPGHDWFRERNARALARMVAGIEEIIDPDKLPPGVDSEVIARWILAVANGLAAQWVLDPAAFNRHQYVARFLVLLEPYLRDRERTERSTDGKEPHAEA